MALSDNLIAAFELNEASGNALDSHGSNTLTDNGTVGAGTGLVYGSARDFEAGNSEYFSRADNADLSIGDVDATWEVWVNPESTGGFPVVLSKGPHGANREYVLYLSSGAPAWELNGNAVTVTWGAALSTATWHQLIFWHDATNNQVGVVVNAGTPVTASYSGGGLDGGMDFQLGAGTSQSLFWDGLMGPVRLWKRVLTSDERTELYNAGAGRTYAYITSGGGGGSIVPRVMHQFRQRR